MAIYHFTVKPISRLKGRSATASAAYRFGVKIFCQRSGDVHDYTRRSGVESIEMTLPRNAPEWANNRAELWNSVEQHETRKNSTVAREFEVSLPKVLDSTQRRELVRAFATELATRHGIAVDSAIHTPGREGDDRNYHAHILTSTRRLGPDGFGEKVRELDSQIAGPKEIERWRERWADLTNKALERAGQSARVDHRSLVAQRLEALASGDMAKAEALDREPTRHLGPVATDDLRRFNRMKKPELATDRAREHLEIIADNAERQSLLRQVRQLREVREVVEWGIEPEPESHAFELARRWAGKRMERAMRAPEPAPAAEPELEAMRAPAEPELEAMRAPAAEPELERVPEPAVPDLTQEKTHERSPNHPAEHGRAPFTIAKMPRLWACASIYDSERRRRQQRSGIAYDDPASTRIQGSAGKRAGSARKSLLQSSAHVDIRQQKKIRPDGLQQVQVRGSSSTIFSSSSTVSTVVETALDDLERMRPEPEQASVELEAMPEPSAELEAMPEPSAELEAMPEPAVELEAMPEPAVEQGMFATLRAQFRRIISIFGAKPIGDKPAMQVPESAEPALERAIAPPEPAVELEAIRVSAAELGLEPLLTAQAAATRLTGLEAATRRPPVDDDNDNDLGQKM